MRQVETVHRRPQGAVDTPQVLEQADEGAIVLEGHAVGEQLADPLHRAQELGLWY